jgi:hypothetical protein
MLLPGLVGYVTHIATCIMDGGPVEKYAIGASEVVKAFAAFFTTVPVEQRK